MSSFRDTAEGWINFISSYSKRFSKSEKENVERRAEICRTCPHLVKASARLIKRWPFQCNLCGCVFPVIAYSKNKKCPLGKWNL